MAVWYQIIAKCALRAPTKFGTMFFLAPLYLLGKCPFVDVKPECPLSGQTVPAFTRANRWCSRILYAQTRAATAG